MQSLKIIFDGGTTCNIPKKGFGRGYGSYQIEGGDVVKVDHGPNHSCNSAEVLTLVSAIKSVQSTERVHLHIIGDSRITLKWVKKKGMPGDSVTPMFREAVAELKNCLLRFPSRSTEWWPRFNSVNLFGH